MTIIIHTPGRVGSQAILNALRKNTSHDAVGRIVHTHYMTVPNGELYRPGYIIRQGQTAVITVVRDPIARNVSAFGVANRGELTVKNFLRTYPHRIPLDWMRGEFYEAWGVHPDEFSDQVMACGVGLVKRDDLLVLCFKYSNINQIPTVLNQHLGLTMPEISVYAANQKQEYMTFKRSAKFPTWYVDAMYRSRFVTEFFQPEEVLAWRELWEETI